MPFIPVKNKNVFIIDMNSGGKETIIMIHGLFANLSLFYFNIAPELSKHFRVILYDLRSHGMSERREEGYTLNILSGDLVTLMETLHIPQAHLVGYSFGGTIALYTALHYPEKVGKLAIIDSPDLNENNIRTLLERYKGEFAEQSFADYTASTGIKISKRKKEKTQELLQYLFNNDRLKTDLSLDRRFLSEAPLEQISNSVLLLYGNRSSFLETGRIKEKRIPHAVLHIGKGDHNLPVQSGTWVCAQLIKFFMNRPIRYSKRFLTYFTNLF
jgi:pimeloyl-ACP methyl ester carboxylesterase